MISGWPRPLRDGCGYRRFVECRHGRETMFQAKRPLFIYCLSPVHMGAGTALGIIDNPIQRERHTGHPMMAGSGLKGAVRHHVWSQLPEGQRRNGAASMLHRIFGPDSGNADDHAGAISFGDAQLVCFPVRCLKRSFVYATSATALARARRGLAAAGVAAWSELSVGDNTARAASDATLDNGKLLLEAFDYQAQVDEGLRAVAEWLAEHALPAAPEYNYFRDKLKSDLVLLPDEDFNHFVRNATVVEPHVRIDDVSGTADDGGLFYTENLPPESLLLSLVMATVERRKKGANGNGLMSAEEVLAKAVGGWKVDGEGRVEGLRDAFLQVGGDATTGRGLVALHFAGGESHDQ